MPNKTPLADFFEPSSRAVRSDDTRRLNERAVLTIVALTPGISNAAISRRAGLSPQTVSVMLADLERQGLIVRGEMLRGHPGQPSTPFRLNPRGILAVGCELGWRHARTVLINVESSVLRESSKSYRYPEPDGLLNDAANMIKKMLEGLERSDRKHIAGLGLAMPGTFAKNVGLLAPPDGTAERWAAIDVKSELEKRTGVPVSLVNDGSAGCWSELAALAAPRPGEIIYLLIGTFVGGGVIMQNSLLHGPHGNAANLGSMLVPDRTGELKTAHEIASLFALETRLREAGLAAPTGEPLEWDWPSLEPVLSEWLEDAAKALGHIVLNTVAVTEATLVVLDGVMPAGIVDRLLERTRHYAASSSPLTFDPPRIVGGKRGGLGPAIGAAQLCMYRRHFSHDINDVLAIG